MSTSSTAPKKSGLSLYADLLDPDKNKSQNATISGAPVKYDLQRANDEAEDQQHQQKKKDASLKFQPIKRPQAQVKRPVKASTSSSLHHLSSSTATASASSPEKSTLASTPQQPPEFQRTNFDDWVRDDEEDFGYQDRSRQRRKKKKKQGRAETRTWDWDDIYDPTLPNNYADYKGSEEQILEIRDWKARLYYHQMRNGRESGKHAVVPSDDEDEERPRQMNRMFAPPSSLQFAPPRFDDETDPKPLDDYNDLPVSHVAVREDESDDMPRFAQSSASEDATHESGYARDIRMGGASVDEVPPPPPPPPLPPALSSGSSPPTSQAPAQMMKEKSEDDVEAKRAAAQAKIAAFKAKLGKPPSNTPAAIALAPVPDTNAPPQPSVRPPIGDEPPPPPPPPPSPPTETPVEQAGGTISRAPVRYQLPPPPPDMEEEPLEDEDDTAADEPSSEETRSNRPGQKGFAERLLMKYGWEKGQGLGAQGEGITTAIVAKADKRKKRPDAEGGGFATPANMGRIVGGKRRKVASNEAENDAQYGVMSEVVKLEGMLDGLDVQKEIEEHNLLQEIGDQMGSKYGNVERLFIWRIEAGGKNEVFVKFTSQLSALRAVNATDGMAFAGNDVVARFFDAEKFEAGEYT